MSFVLAQGPAATEGHHIIIQALWNTRRANPLPFSQAAIDVFRLAVIDAPGHVGYTGHGGYNAAVRAEVNAWLAANRINPATMTEAQARQLVHHIRNSPIPAIRDFFARILVPAARSGATTGATTAAGSAARTAATRTGFRMVGTVARFALGPIGIALSEIFISPSSTASAASLQENMVMRPPASPEIYYLYHGTIILPSGEIYIPGPDSTYVPPRGSLIVIGRVVGNGLRAGQQFPPNQVAPYPFDDVPTNPAAPSMPRVQ